MKYLIAILILLHLTISQGSILYKGTTHYSTTVHYWNGDDFLSTFDPFSARFELYESGSSVFNGSVVLIPFHYGVDYYAEEVKSRGAIGIVMGATTNSGRAGYQMQRPRGIVDFPTLQLSNVDYEFFLEEIMSEENVTAVFEIDSPESNPWTASFAMVILLYPMSLGVIFCLLFGLILIAAYLSYRQEGTAFNLRKILLLTSFLLVFIRGLWVMTDPMGARRIFSSEVPILFHATNVIVSVENTIILSLFWFEKLSKGPLLEQKTFLKKTKGPFLFVFVFNILVWMSILLLFVIKSSFIDTYLNILLGIYLFLWLSLGIFHIVCTFTFMNRLDAVRANSNKKKNTANMMKKVVAITVFDILMITSLIFSFMVPFTNTPILSPLFMAFYLLMGVGQITSILLIFRWDWTYLSSTVSRTSKQKQITETTKH